MIKNQWTDKISEQQAVIDAQRDALAAREGLMYRQADDIVSLNKEVLKLQTEILVLRGKERGKA